MRTTEVVELTWSEVREAVLEYARRHQKEVHIPVLASYSNVTAQRGRLRSDEFSVKITVYPREERKG